MKKTMLSVILLLSMGVIAQPRTVEGILTGEEETQTGIMCFYDVNGVQYIFAQEGPFTCPMFKTFYV